MVTSKKPKSMSDEAFAILSTLRDGTKKLAEECMPENWMEAETPPDTDELDKLTTAALARVFGTDPSVVDEICASLYGMYGPIAGAAVIAGIVMGIEFAHETDKNINGAEETA